MHTFLMDLNNERQQKFKEDFPESFNGIQFNLDVFLYYFGYSESLFIKKRYKLDLKDKRAQLLLEDFPEAMDGEFLDIQELSEALDRDFYLFGNNQPDTDLDDLGDNVDVIVRWTKQRIRENRNCSMLFSGETGSGKSYSAIALAEKLDPGFNVNRIVFNVEDFLKLSTSNLPKGSVIIFDDAGVGASNKEWNSLSGRIIGKFSQNSRYLNLINIYTVPSLNYIEKQSRELINLYFESTKIQGDAKVFHPFRVFRGADTLGFKYPKLWIGNIPITISKLHFNLASRDLLEAYENAKQTYMNRVNKEFLHEIQEAQREKKEKLNKKNGKGKGDNKKETNTDIIKIIKLKMKGLSVRDIAKSTGVPRSTVQRVISEIKSDDDL